MSYFDDVLQEHEKEMSDEATKNAKEELLEKKSREAFLSAFEEIASNIVVPAFKSFYDDANRNEFPSKIEDGTNGYGNPYVSLRFLPIRKGKIDENRSEECVVMVVGIYPIKKIEVKLYYDQRQGRSRSKTYNFYMQKSDSIDMNNILAEFLRLSLNERK